MDIHVLLTGRLGNQLFQYAFAKYLQKKYGGKIYLNTYDLDHRSGNRKKVSSTKFNYDMKEFVLDSDVVLEDKKMPWYADLSNPIIRIVKKISPKLLFKYMAKNGYLLWQKSTYIEIPLLKTQSVFAHGYWQDVKYLYDVNDELRHMIAPVLPMLEKNSKLYDIAKEHNSVCVSIRGGNYLNPMIKKSLFVCDRDYFIKSIKRMCEMVDKPSFIVFSDDLKWVKDYIKFEQEFPQLNFYYEDGTDAVAEKIRLMSMCSHFIISNSSFSWWAQYLSDNKKKIVIAPKSWFRNGKKCGLYMDNWILMDVNIDE